MSEYYKTSGFVIAKSDLKEADQLFGFYSKDFGKVRILGKSIRKIRSKLRAGVDMMYFSELEFVQGKGYKTLTDASVLEKYKDIRTNLNKLEIANRICETADSLIRGQEKDEGIFNLLNEVFNKLNNFQFSILNFQLMYHYFFWNFVSLLGYRIDMYDCPLCQGRFRPEGLCFMPEEGAVVCHNCSRGEIIEILPEAVKMVRFLTENGWERVSKLKFGKKHMEGLEDLSLRYLGYLKSMARCV